MLYHRSVAAKWQKRQEVVVKWQQRFWKQDRRPLKSTHKTAQNLPEGQPRFLRLFNELGVGNYSWFKAEARS